MNDYSTLNLINQNLCDGGFDPASLLTDIEALYADNCDDEVNATVTNTTGGMNNTDCSWTYTYEYTIVDNCMNETTCEVVVSGGDTEEPMLVNPLVSCSSLDVDDQNICLSVASAFDGETLEDEVAALYDDNCDMAVTATLVDTIHGGANSDCSWSITYVYEIVDNC